MRRGGGGRGVRKGAKKANAEMARKRNVSDRRARRRTDAEKHGDDLRDGAGLLGGDLNHGEESVGVRVFERWCAGGNADDN